MAGINAGYLRSGEPPHHRRRRHSHSRRRMQQQQTTEEVIDSSPPSDARAILAETIVVAAAVLAVLACCRARKHGSRTRVFAERGMREERSTVRTGPHHSPPPSPPPGRADVVVAVVATGPPPSPAPASVASALLAAAGRALGSPLRAIESLVNDWVAMSVCGDAEFLRRTVGRIEAEREAAREPPKDRGARLDEAFERSAVVWVRAWFIVCSFRRACALCFTPAAACLRCVSLFP